MRNVPTGSMGPITYKLEEMGCKIDIMDDQRIDRKSGVVFLKAPPRLSAAEITHTLPHPGFPTDMQAQLTALASVASGESVIRETVFSSRIGHVGALKAMGADIEVSADNSMITITGADKLRGATVEATDLRGGAALILAGLCAHGETCVTQSHHVERGYETIVEDLRCLGADVVYV